MKFYKENNINPAASCLPMLAQFPVFIALYFTLQAPRRTHITGHSWLHVVPTSPTTGDLALVGLRAARDLRRLARSRRRTSWRRRWTRRSGTIMMVLPLVFIVFVSRLPDRARPLLGDDEPVDGRPGPDHAAARCRSPARPPRGPRARSARSRTAAAADAGSRRNGATAAEPPKPADAAAAAAASSEEEGRRAAVSRERHRRGDRARPSARRSGRRCASSSGSRRGSTRRPCGSRCSPRASAACSASATRRPA